jgi:hypothetical protein
MALTDTDNKPASRRVRAGSRTYFFDIKQTSEGKNFLIITESRFKGKEEGHTRQSIVVFPEQAQAFLKALTRMIVRL